MAKNMKALIPIGIGAVALLGIALFATGASADEFDPIEEDDDPEIDPDVTEEVPDPDVVEEVKKETGVDLGGDEGWTDEKIGAFLGSLGYSGSLGSKVRQFQRDSRVNPLKNALMNAGPVTMEIDEMSLVDGKVGPKTIEQLNRVGVLAASLQWKPAQFLFKGGEAKFFEALKDMGYTITRRTEQATKQFQRDAKASFGIPTRTDGHVDANTLSALALALTEHALGNWVAG